MTNQYHSVGWNRQKKRYDLAAVGGVALCIAGFAAGSLIWHPNITIETLLIRSLGSTAFLLLHVILSIGPLARLDRRFLPLLYNRRHLGVLMFVIAAGHAALATIQFHALGNLNPLVSILATNPPSGELGAFPFHAFGLAALAILFLMAATSHDFWLANLTAPVWKALHMGVYLAYALLIAHVALGVLQSERHPLYAVLVGAGVLWVFGLHLVAALSGRRADRDLSDAGGGPIKACLISDIPEKRARVVSIGGERVAIFKYDGRIAAISSVCQHQNGPLGEGCVIDGLITCPWHGYQYEPGSGASPAPYEERVPTFDVELRGEEVWVDPRPNPPGTSANIGTIT